MDPVSALGVAAAIAQFVGMGILVAKRLAEYTATNPMDVPRPLQSINSRLPLLLSALSRMKSEDEVKSLDVDSRCILRGVVSGCMRLVEEIEEIEKKLVPQPGENMRTKLKKVMSSLNIDEKIANIDRSLQTYIQVLILHHVVDKEGFDAAILQEDGYFEVKEKLVNPFARRENLISKIDEAFYGPIRRQTAEPQIAILTGKSGSGKTQLAVGYCREAFDLRHFHLVFWLDASSGDAYRASLQSTAIAIKHSNEGTVLEKYEFLKQYLTNNWEPWLLVIDNYNRKALPENELLSYLPNKGYGGILIITESESFAAKSTMISVPKYLDRDENEEYRQQMSGAIETSRYEDVKSIVLLGVNVNQKVNIGWSFLARAALMGSEPIVRLLLANGADNLPAPGQRSALGWAAYDGRDGVVKLLLDHEDKTNKYLEPNEYREAVLNAIGDGHTESARAILSRRDIKLGGSSDILSKKFSSCSRKGKLETLRYLLSIGAVPTDDSEKGDALRSAIDEARVDVVKFLLTEAHFSVDAIDQHGACSLITAASLQSREHKAARDELVTMLLKAGANPNKQSNNGETALQAAALRESVETVNQLLEAGADPTIADHLGFTPLLSACKFKSPLSFPPLVAIDISDAAKRKIYFEKALFYSARFGSRELLAAIIDKVDVNTVEEHSGDTPLLLSIKREHAQVARYLIRRGADPSFKDSEGNMPILLAAQKGMDLVVRDLAKPGPNKSSSLEVKDAKGNTALHLAAAANCATVIQELLKAGADIDAENTYGEIAMDIAEEKKLKDVIKALSNTKV